MHFENTKEISMNIVREDIISLLMKNILEVNFTKKDGSNRKMVCSLQEKHLPEQIDLVETINKTKNLEVISAWDLEKNSWRSFRIDSITDYKVISLDGW
jgi:hypothetical protein